MQQFAFLLLIFACVVGCENNNNESGSQVLVKSTIAKTSGKQTSEADIRKLIEQLVYSDGAASKQPVVNPNMKIADSDGNVRPINGDSDDAEKQRQKFNSCEEAFTKLYELREVAIPFLVEHLDDKRQSIHFRNHHMGNSVGDACFWNIYFQLVDEPRDYSEYGHSRKGRNGEDHPKPYWEGTPFDDAGGLKEWLNVNKELNYLEMQIKSVQWLLDREKMIGASDTDSYFLNILPLEIRILERRLENGDDVKTELDRLIEIRDKRLEDQIPKELLPDN